MEITIKELQQLNENQYQLIDIRSKTEISHGAIPGAVCASAENIEENQEIDFSKKLVICCSRGKVSVEMSSLIYGSGTPPEQGIKDGGTPPEQGNEKRKGPIRQ